MRGKSVYMLAVVLLVGCSEGATSSLPAADSSAVEEVAADVGVDTAREDTSVVDSGVDSSAPDTSKPDTGTPVFDTPAGESGGVLFACGATSCSSSFQYCKRATGPGICPMIDAGICPAGCPGCPPLPLACETMPTKCWAKPSCACLLTEVCGSSSAGDCTEKDGGFTVGCRGA